jgi:hypothetical protein
VDSSHNTRFPSIQMEGRPVNVFVSLLIIEDSNWVVRPIKVMIINDNFSAYLSSFEFRAQVVFNKISFVFSSKVHTWIISWMKRLILRRDRINIDSFALHALNILNEI